MDNVVPAEPAVPSARSLPPRRPTGGGTLLTLVNGALAGVGGVYAGTHSVLVTVIAVSAAVVLAVLVLAFQR